MQNKGGSSKDTLTGDDLKKLLKDPVLEELERFEKTRGKLRLPIDIKPCITRLLDGASPRVKDGDNAFIVACELHRVGRSERQIESILIRAGVERSKVRGAVGSAITGKYGYACPRLEELGLCLHKDRFQCWWFEKIPRQSQKNYRDRDFWRYGWPGKLRPHYTAIIVYLAIREIEKKRRIYPGSLLYISTRELSRTSGVALGWIGECCEKLKNAGLIEFKRGKQHRWYGKANEIRRIIPIPKPKV